MLLESIRFTVKIGISAIVEDNFLPKHLIELLILD